MKREKKIKAKKLLTLHPYDAWIMAIGKEPLNSATRWLMKHGLTTRQAKEKG